MRFLTIYFLSIKSFFHKLRYDLINEVVVGICSLVLIATFVYIFNDFLNDKIESLSSNMRHVFAITSSLLLLVILSLTGSKYIAKDLSLSEHASFLKICLQLGETPANIRTFITLRIITILTLCFGIYWFVTYKYLIPWPLNTAIILQLLAVILVGAFAFKNLRSQSLNNNESKLFAKYTGTSFKSSMVIWRLKQLILRNKFTRYCLIIALCCVLLLDFNIINHGAFFVSVFISFVAGLFASIALSFQLKEDLDYAWAERSMGVSHEMFIDTYKNIGLILTTVLALFILLGAIINIVLHGSLQLTADNIFSTLKLVVIAGVAPFITPNAMFQIDPKRPMIQVLIILMIGLFTATAVYASWLGLLLFPIISYYGRDLQKGRFYRA